MFSIHFCKKKKIEILLDIKNIKFTLNFQEKVEPASEVEESPVKIEKKAEGEEKVPSADDEDAEDNKLWADVDKDLGDILAGEAEAGNKSSDEDDDSHANGERYDR